jgi:nanoRNase/pAp phosphatase (c-di-AMP/oligoRNAs hydrolase)
MISTEQVQQFQEILTNARTISVLIGNQTTDEQVSAASGLALALQNSGKEVQFVGPRQAQSLPAYLQENELYSNSLGKQNLVISFDYDESAVENVAYHIGEETGKFYLTVKPRTGHKPLDTSSVEFAYAGAQADLVILVGVSSYDSLEHLYAANEQFFSESMVISLHTYETSIGSIKFDTSGEPGLSVAVAKLVRDTNLSVSESAATNLLAGIEQSTNNFTSLSTTADALELAAWLMRMGARRVWRSSTAGSSSDKKPAEAQSFAEVFTKKSTENKSKKSKKSIGGLDYEPSATSTSS